MSNLENFKLLGQNYCTEQEKALVLSNAEGLKRSTRFKCIATDKVDVMFKDYGLTQLGVSVNKVRKAENMGFQRHLLAYTHESFKIDDHNQAILLYQDSKDGRTASSVFAGAFRSACANTLMSNGLMFDSLRHCGNYEQKLEESIKEFMRRLPLLQAQIVAMQQRKLTASEQIELAASCAKIRAKSIDSLKYVDLNSVIKTRRVEDQDNDLWTTFNVVQENCIRGGIKYQYVKENGDLCLNTTRALRSVLKSAEINRNLWSEAEKLLAA